MSEQVPYDDDSANMYQHNLPRISGGGRKLNSDVNYECLWCPKDVIRLGKKGRFREIKSYRRHFMEYHQGVNGVSMTEFVERVQRNEPTWFCEVCNHHYSLDNEIRHRAICKPNQLSTESDDEEPRETNAKQIQDNRKKSSLYKRIKKPFTLDSSTSDDDDDAVDQSRVQVTQEAPEGSNDPKRHILDTSIDKSFQPTDKQQRIDKEKSLFDCETVQPTVISVLAPCKDPKINNDYTFLEVKDEILLEENDDNVELQIEIKLENNEEVEENINKWWLNVPKHLYTDRNTGGPRIFLPSDTNEFVNLCHKRYMDAIQEKSILDQKMIEKESPEEKLLQFSEFRDKTILDKYTNFVQSSSTKDILNLFSAEYKELDIPTGLKSSTAGQYANRIIEFFNFMASKYKGFHLDWFVDYKKEIKKTYPDGTDTNEIFFPTKEDVTEFIKQFKYGGTVQL